MLTALFRCDTGWCHAKIADISGHVLCTSQGMFCEHLRACSLYISGHVLCTSVRVSQHRQFAADSECIEINSASEENDTLAC